MIDEMTPRIEPRPCSERELTLRAIAATFHRARAAQRELLARTGGGQSTDNPVPGPEGDGSSNEQPDRLIDLSNEAAQLPHPLRTDGHLHHYLEQATVLADPHGPGLKGRLWRALSPSPWRRQAGFNAALVHALHQLDHRGRHQQNAIARLEAETAALRRALARAEARLHDQS